MHEGPQEMTLQNSMNTGFTQTPTGIQVTPKEVTLNSTLNPKNYAEASNNFVKNAGRSGRIDMYDMRRKTGPKYSEQEKEDIIAKLRDRDDRMVTGIFNNYEERSYGYRNSKHKMIYRKHYGDAEFYEFEDNIRYTIPYGLAHHLQFDCYTYSYNYLPDEMFKDMQQAFNPEGRMIFGDAHLKEQVPRFGFIPIDFHYELAMESNKSMTTLGRM